MHPPFGVTVAAALFTSIFPAFSQAPEITSFSQNGLLVCSQLAPGTVATVERASTLGVGTIWEDMQSGIVAQDGTIHLNLPMSQVAAPEFYRVRGTGWPANMALIPAGSFSMGDSLDGHNRELPLHSVFVSSFWMDRYEVTKALWDDVFKWATNHGYSFDSSNSGQGKAADHPAHSMSWYDAVKWCNARSEKEDKTPAYYTDAGLSNRYKTGQREPYVKWNSGYRLPTEAEWEKAARGGVNGRRFPWSDTDTITHQRANCYSDSSFAYDVSITRGYHPAFNDGVFPYTSPVGYFAPNGYGLYDMAGNVYEWCWDWYDSYSSESQSDPTGPTSGLRGRVPRGGGWGLSSPNCRTAYRYYYEPWYRVNQFGFRTVLPMSP